MGGTLSAEASTSLNEQLISFVVDECRWKPVEVRLFHHWFVEHSTDGNFRWNHFRAVVDGGNRLPTEFVSRAWALAVLIGSRKPLRGEGVHRPAGTALHTHLRATAHVTAADLRASSAQQKQDLEALERERSKLHLSNHSPRNWPGIHFHHRHQQQQAGAGEAAKPIETDRNTAITDADSTQPSGASNTRGIDGHMSSAGDGNSNNDNNNNNNVGGLDTVKGALEADENLTDSVYGREVSRTGELKEETGDAAQEVRSEEEGGKSAYDIRHALDNMSFPELVWLLKEMDEATYETQVRWAHALFAVAGVVHVSHMVDMAKQVVPILFAELKDSEMKDTKDEDVPADAETALQKCLAFIVELFQHVEGRPLDLDAWVEIFTSPTRKLIFKSRARMVYSGFGLFTLLKQKRENIKRFGASLTFQGRLWLGRHQVKVKVENNYLSMVSVLKEYLGFTETYRLVDAEVNYDRRHKHRFEVKLADGTTFRFLSGTEAGAQSWVNAVMYNIIPASSSFRFQSFSPARESVPCKWYVDGESYFADLLHVIRAAREEILITDWAMSPEIYLTRDEGSDARCRLDIALIERARAGVRVRIMLWWQSDVATRGTVNAGHVVKRFKKEKNILVVMHPSGTFPSKWSHHQKSCIVDRALGFCGGLDLCYGRFDSPQHELKDDCHLHTRFPGKDYYNQFIMACDELSLPWQEKVDRYTLPREPWHDIQLGVSRGCAGDLARNFAQRWNHHVKEMGLTDSHGLLNVSTVDGEGPTPDRFKFWVDAASLCDAQICRSLSRWSGNSATEQSIYNAYQQAIHNSQHFIYIENQFFISSFGSIRNQISNMLADRLIRAVDEKTPFKIVIVLPLHPEGSFAATSTRILFKFCYKTIVMMRNRFESKHPRHRFGDYVHFATPMQRDRIGDRYFLQLIYVHSKLMIVDDRIVICGSANINDRSMLGDRDSELAAVIEGKAEVESIMGGKTFMVSSFAHSLRMSLWAEHLGLNEHYMHLIKDPCSMGFETWKRIAESNERVLHPVIELNPDEVFKVVATGFGRRVRRRGVHSVDRTLATPLVKEFSFLMESQGDCLCCSEHSTVAPCAKCGNLTCGDCFGWNLLCHLCESRHYCPKSVAGGHHASSSEDDEESDADSTSQTSSTAVRPERLSSAAQRAVEKEAARVPSMTGILQRLRSSDRQMETLYCEFGNGVLQFFQVQGGAPKGYIEIGVDMTVQRWSDGRNGFTLVDVEHNRTYQFSCETEDMQKAWMLAIRSAISTKKRIMFSKGEKGVGATRRATGLVKDGHVLDTAREFLIMDKMVDAPTASPQDESPLVPVLEQDVAATEAAEDEADQELREDLMKSISPGRYQETAEDQGNELQLADGKKIANDGTVKKALAVDAQKGKEEADDDKLADGAARKTFRERIDHVGEKFEEGFQKIQGMFHDLGHVKTADSFDQMQGFIVPYPINYVPRIATDIYAAAPTDIFA